MHTRNNTLHLIDPDLYRLIQFFYNTEEKYVR